MPGALRAADAEEPPEGIWAGVTFTERKLQHAHGTPADPSVVVRQAAVNGLVYRHCDHPSVPTGGVVSRQVPTRLQHIPPKPCRELVVTRLFISARRMAVGEYVCPLRQRCASKTQVVIAPELAQHPRQRLVLRHGDLASRAVVCAGRSARRPTDRWQKSLREEALVSGATVGTSLYSTATVPSPDRPALEPPAPPLREAVTARRATCRPVLLPTRPHRVGGVSSTHRPLTRTDGLRAWTRPPLPGRVTPVRVDTPS